MSAVAAKITPSAPAANRFRVGLAYTPAEVLETQRLRYRVFAEEMGAQIKDGGQRIDRDWLDHFCHHLLVRDTETGQVVASTRLITDAQAQAAGGFYSAQEFDLRNILALPGRKLEVGRTCVHPDYRSGAVIALLWAGLAEFVRERGFAWLFGCASIELNDGGACHRPRADGEASGPDRSARRTAHQAAAHRAAAAGQSPATSLAQGLSEPRCQGLRRALLGRPVRHR
jgi:putative hemolysin